jgi:hypothetical protein
MQSCAFFWGKSDILKAYRRDGDLAIVLGREATGDWWEANIRWQEMG